MTVEPSWRIPNSGDDKNDIKQMWVVPDTRLQAIADAWNDTMDRDRGKLRSWVPHLVAAIEDALTEENKT